MAGSKSDAGRVHDSGYKQ